MNNLFNTQWHRILCASLILTSFSSIQSSENTGDKQKSPISLNTVLTVAIPAAIGLGWYTYQQLTKPISTVRMGHMPSRAPHGETINFKPYEPYQWLEIPEKIQDEGWKKLFGNEPINQEIIEGIDKLIHNYLKQPMGQRQPKKFIRAAMGLLAPALKRFELNSVPNEPTMLNYYLPKTKILEFCMCCNARRHHLSLQPDANNSYSSGYPADNFKYFHILVPNPLILLYTRLTNVTNCRVAIASLLHEMMHNARLHALRKHYGSFEKALLHQQEFESDLAPTLILQRSLYIGSEEHDGSWSMVRHFTKRLLREWDMSTLSKGVNPAVCHALAHEDSATHPSDAARIKKILTTSAAHLVHNEKVPKSAALEWVAQNAQKIYRLCCCDADVNNSMYDEVFSQIIEEWKKEQHDDQ